MYSLIVHDLEFQRIIKKTTGNQAVTYLLEPHCFR